MGWLTVADRDRRAAKWETFDAAYNRWRVAPPAPAFIAEVTDGGLWSVQVWCPGAEANFSKMHRLFFDPPQAMTYEGYYNAWPGDHRGWMRFQTKEEARDFYKFATGLMSFDDYRAQVGKRPLSNLRIELDANGDFAPQ